MTPNETAVTPAMLAALAAAMSHRPSKHRAGWAGHFSKEAIATRRERNRIRRKMAKSSRIRNRA
jgi:hypothetical protein